MSGGDSWESLTCKEPLADIDREFVRIPPSTFERLKLTDFDYTNLQYGNVSYKVRACKLLAKDPLINDAIIRIKKRHRDKLGVKPESQLKIGKIEGSKVIKLGVYWGYAKDKEKPVIRIHKNKLKELKIKEGDIVEVFDRKNGGRAYIEALELDMYEEESRIRMGAYLRELLEVKKGDGIWICRNLFPVYKKRTSRIKDFLWKKLIGYNFLFLKVRKGADPDEGKNVVRTHKSNINLLGVTDGDLVDIFWLNENIRCRILESYEKNNLDKEERNYIYICSSERSELELDKYDCIRIRRSPSHILRKNIIEPFMGAVIMGLGLFITSREINIPLDESIVLALIATIMAVYITLAKVRSQV